MNSTPLKYWTLYSVPWRLVLYNHGMIESYGDYLLSTLDTPLTAWLLADLRSQSNERIAALFLKYRFWLDADCSNWDQAVRSLLTGLARDYAPWMVLAGIPCDCAYVWKLTMALAQEKIDGLKADPEITKPGPKGIFKGREFEFIDTVKMIQDVASPPVRPDGWRRAPRLNEDEACTLLLRWDAEDAKKIPEDKRAGIEKFREAVLVKSEGGNLLDRLDEAKAAMKNGIPQQRLFMKDGYLQAEIWSVLEEIQSSQDRKLAIARLCRLAKAEEKTPPLPGAGIYYCKVGAQCARYSSLKEDADDLFGKQLRRLPSVSFEARLSPLTSFDRLKTPADTLHGILKAKGHIDLPAIPKRDLPLPQPAEDGTA